MFKKSDNTYNWLIVHSPLTGEIWEPWPDSTVTVEEGYVWVNPGGNPYNGIELGYADLLTIIFS